MTSANTAFGFTSDHTCGGGHVAGRYTGRTFTIYFGNRQIALIRETSAGRWESETLFH